MLPRIPIIVGPTASGKSDLALALASELKSAVISCDSVQIYKFLDIFAAKPSIHQLREVSHRFVGVLHPHEKWNAGIYGENARAIIRGFLKKGIVPVVAGGTPLWIKSLVHGLVATPAISAEISNQVDMEYEQIGLIHCYDKLYELDPNAADSLHPNDTQRILRALKVILQTGKSLKDYQHEHAFSEKFFEPVYISIVMDRTELYDRINLRTDEMYRNGGLDEVRALLAAGIRKDAPAFDSIGYREAIKHLFGEMSYDEALESTARSTRHYAKRQISWYKKYTGIIHLETRDITQETINRLIEENIKDEFQNSAKNK